jgi:uncharacterized protein YidB (DUF937 family)
LERGRVPYENLKLLRLPEMPATRSMTSWAIAGSNLIGENMSWTDTLKGLAGNAEQAALPQLLEGVLGAEGMQTILAKLQDGGLATQVSSWLDKNRDNLPITADQLRAALGDEHVQRIATSLGIPVDTILNALAQYLPQAASAAAPPAEDEIKH